MLENVKAGLNSQWFRTTRYFILKELEGTGQAKGVIDDRSKERAIASILGSLDGAVEVFTADNDQEGLKAAAELFLMAYVKIGNSALLDAYTDVCERAGMAEEGITESFVKAGDEANQIDISVMLYSRAGAKEKLVETSGRALGFYLEANELDLDSRSRLFDYIVQAYKSAGDEESLLQAGDKALESQIQNRRFSHDKEWVLDAQKAYEAAVDKGRLAKLGDQYVNLYLKERLETWLDKAVVVYKEAEVDFAARLGRLADRLAEKGHTGMADIVRGKAGAS